MSNILSEVDWKPTRSVSTIATGIRLAQYPDGSQRIQGAYQWHQGFKSGYEWRDMEITMVDSKGQEFDCD